MRVAVITPAYNAGPYLAASISSVLAQTHSDLNLIVVDDGSVDDTARVAASFTDPRLRFIHQPNAGVSVARNRGLALVGKCDAVLFLDADDWLAPMALSTLTATLARSPRAAAACGRYARVAADGLPLPASPPPEGPILEALLTRNLFANGGHVLIPTGALGAVGGFRSDLAFGEDWELWTRLALIGEFINTPETSPVLYVREHAASVCYRCATDAALYARALDVMYRNPVILSRFGPRRLRGLRRRADAESAWAIGRAWLRAGNGRVGTQWLFRSFANRPTVKRLCLIALLMTGLNGIQLCHADGARWR